ncbi:dolichyl-phosphate-mannose--protein mannosyltransferase, partial [Vibrio harveyi]
GTAAVLPALLMIAMLVLNMGKADSRSDRIIFAQINDNAPVFYIGKRPFSGQFYSHGQAKKLEDKNDLNNLKKFHLIGKSQQVDSMIHENALSCTNEFTAKSKRSLYTCVVG